MIDRAYISVIMPVFNTERYVAEAIESVLNQKGVSLELICVDDGSTDGTGDILATYGTRITHITLPHNSGASIARNTGISYASGTFIAFMDADDLWDEHKLAKQTAQCAEDPELDVLFTNMQCFVSPELSAETAATRECPEEPMPGYAIPAMVVKRSSFDCVGPFDPTWRVGELADWFTRAKEAGLRHALLPETLLFRRIHETNTGITRRSARIDYVRIVRAALGRKKDGS